MLLSVTYIAFDLRDKNLTGYVPVIECRNDLICLEELSGKRYRTLFLSLRTPSQ